MNCNICPRNCNKTRENGNEGYCGTTNIVKIARASLHMWEEPCISGEKGSGAVFFSGCNLRCVYCQNKDISGGQQGKPVSIEELADVFVKLQDEEHANNINLVTPSHYVPQIVSALNKAKSQGLKIPIVYNTGSYEKADTLRMLDGYIDVYLPDCKYYDDERALKYSFAHNYFEVAIKAIDEMFRQTGTPIFNEHGIMTKGVIVRHLILPQGTKDSKCVIKEIYDRFGDDVYLSLMSQYTPMLSTEDTLVQNKYPELTRKITKREYNRVVDYAIELGIINAFIQEGDVAKESFIPRWDY